MRKRPVLPLMFRRAVKDVHIGPYLFPAGTIIEVHVLAMNTHPLYWDRPDDFLPVCSRPQTYPNHLGRMPILSKEKAHLGLTGTFGTQGHITTFKSFKL